MRYDRNRKMITRQDNERLSNSKVAVIGCGGLGGYIIEMLARIGIGHLVCIDGDVFDETNWNRQLLSSEVNKGHSKALAAKERVSLINSEVVVEAYDFFLSAENVSVLKDCHLIVDAVDSVEGKLMLQKIASSLNVPLVYGAIAGWYGQVTTILPGDDTLDLIYRSKKTIEKELGNPSFTPATIASIQVAEVIKLLLNQGDILQNKVLFIDLLSQEYEMIEFD